MIHSIVIDHVMKNTLGLYNTVYSKNIQHGYNIFTKYFEISLPLD